MPIAFRPSRPRSLKSAYLSYPVTNCFSPRRRDAIRYTTSAQRASRNGACPFVERGFDWNELARWVLPGAIAVLRNVTGSGCAPADRQAWRRGPSCCRNWSDNPPPDQLLAAGPVRQGSLSVRPCGSAWAGRLRAEAARGRRSADRCGGDRPTGLLRAGAAGAWFQNPAAALPPAERARKEISSRHSRRSTSSRCSSSPAPWTPDRLPGGCRQRSIRRVSAR